MVKICAQVVSFLFAATMVACGVGEEAIDATSEDAMGDAAPMDSFTEPDATATPCPIVAEVGSLVSGDPTFTRPYLQDGNCSPSGTGTEVFYAVHTYKLTGPGPHDLVASTCDAATVDTVIAIYQAPGGAAPFDPSTPCENIMGFGDDDDACGGGTSYATAGSLKEGEVAVVVTTFGNGDSGSYTLSISSGTCVLP